MAFEGIKQGLLEYTKEIERKTGHWINARVDFVCSNCFKHSKHKYNSCPSCDAKMDDKTHP